MKRISLLVAGLVGASPLLCWGQWQPEQIIYPGAAQNDQKVTCSQFPGTTTHFCVLEIGTSTSLHLYEIQSTDGGVSWSSPVQVTADSPAEYDPSMQIDFARGRLSMIYSKNGSIPGSNDLMIRQKLCLACGWSSPVTVVADGGNNWDAHLLVAGNGDLLALETLEGFGGTGPGKIRQVRSTDGGASWGSPTIIIDESGEETFPAAVQKSDGVIHLMFRDTSHGGGQQIGQIWSGDYGYTWSGHSVFAYDPANPREFYSIASQGGINETVLAGIGNRLHHWTSWDNGNSWEGPYQTTTTTGSQDGEISMGCRGPIFTFNGPGFSAHELRFDTGSTCP
jgi:hypothetical protein